MLRKKITHTLHPKANEGKHLEIVANEQVYLRYPVKTHIISNKDNINKVVLKYTGPFLKNDDVIVLSERVVAITQNRMYLIKDIKPTWLSKFLVKFVFKPSWGIGIGSPYTMQVAIEEAGVLRIVFAALVSALTKPFGIRGAFYHIAGHQINAIDGPTPYTLPPGNEAATLGPKEPDKVAVGIKKFVQENLKVSVEVVIIDSNDIGRRIEGATGLIDRELMCQIFRDNPLGQSREQTPMAIVRIKK